MRLLLRDIRFASRRLVRRRGGTLLAVLMLSLGIGATAVFHLLVRGAINDVPPLPAVDRVARIWIVDNDLKSDRIPPSPSDWSAWSAASDVRSSLAPVGFGGATTEIAGRSIELSVQYVSEKYFDVLGVRPQIGRVFGPGDAAAAIVSARVWKRLEDRNRRLA